MPLVIVDHHLKDFEAWFKLFLENPAPKVGQWHLLRGSEDPNRVVVIGEFTEAEKADVQAFAESDRMQAVFAEVDAMSTQPLEWIWLDEVKPG